MVQFRLQKFSYRFAEEVLNSRLPIKQEIEGILADPQVDLSTLSRDRLNKALRERFASCGWEVEPVIFQEPGDPAAKMDFLKERVGMEVQLSSSSTLGIDLLKFQVASYSNLDKIDVGVYVVTTAAFRLRMMAECGQGWRYAGLSYEQVVRYLPHLKSAIQVPVWVVGIDF